MKKKIALITGASSGLGYESARQLAARGYDLVVVARRRAKLEELAATLFKQYHTTTHVVALDLLDEKSIFELMSYLRHNWLTLDLFLNNAGFGDYNEFKNADIRKLEAMVTLNVMRLTQLTYHLLPFMNPKGQICNVGSLAGFMPGPNMDVYYATKSYVLNFSLALAMELKKQDVSVSVFVPGPVATEFNDVAKAEKKGESPFSLKMLGSQDVQAAIKALLAGLDKRKKIVYSKKEHALLVRLIGLVPHTAMANIMAKFQHHRFVKE